MIGYYARPRAGVSTCVRILHNLQELGRGDIKRVEPAERNLKSMRRRSFFPVLSPFLH